MASFLATASGQIAPQGDKLVASDAVGLASQGYSVAISADGNTAVVGGRSDNNGIGAAWVYTRSAGAWTQQGPKLVGTGAVGGAGQGSAVAISGDGNTVAVGGASDNSGVGAVWVFVRSNGNWSQQGPKLVGDGYAGHPLQGSSVAMSTDGNTIISGAPYDANGGPTDYFGTGAAWVFARSNGTWTQQGAKLVGTGSVVQTNPFTAQTIPAAQGTSVAISGDGATAIVGGYDDNLFTGAAWIFVKTHGVWTQQGSKLTGAGAASTSSAGSHQGSSLALSADGNTALVGGYFDAGGTGAAWVFTRGNGVWSQLGSKLVGVDRNGASQQGTAVALSADGNTALVGGFADNKYVGAAWVYSRIGDSWSQRGTKLVAADAVGPSLQGWAAAISGDGSTAIVGGYGDNGGASSHYNGAGAAWIYQIPPLPTAVQGVKLQQTELTAGNSLPGTVTLTANAPAGGALVTLSSSSTLLSVPPTVSVPAGSNTTAFTATAGPVTLPEPVTITASYGGASAQATVTIVPGPVIISAGVVSANAFGQFRSTAPGSWIEIYGSDLAVGSRSWTTADFSGITAPTSLDGTEVTIGGQPAYIDYVNPTQINALAPSTAPIGSQRVVVSLNGVSSPPYTITVNPLQPGLLAPASFVVGGYQYVAAILPDGGFALPPGAVSGVTARRAHPGEIVTLYGIGFGPVIPDIPAGEIAQTPNILASPLHVFFGDTEATATYAGLSQGSVGLYQLNLVVPAVASSDTTPITFTLNGTAGSQTLYIAVQ